MVGRACEVDADAAEVPVEAGIREVDVPVANGACSVGLDCRLVVELPEQVRRRRAFCDNRRPVVLETVATRRPGLTLRIAEARDPDVAERLLRSGRVVGALGAEERAAMCIPS